MHTPHILIVVETTRQGENMGSLLNHSNERAFEGVSDLWSYITKKDMRCPDVIWISKKVGLVSDLIRVLADKVKSDKNNWANPNLRIYVDGMGQSTSLKDAVFYLSQVFKTKGFPHENIVLLDHVFPITNKE